MEKTLKLLKTDKGWKWWPRGFGSVNLLSDGKRAVALCKPFHSEYQRDVQAALSNEDSLVVTEELREEFDRKARMMGDHWSVFDFPLVRI